MCKLNKKKIFSKILRLLILLVIPILSTIYYWHFVSSITYTSIDIVNLIEAGRNQDACFQLSNEIDKFYKALDVVKNKVEGLSSLIKLPGNLSGYNLYIVNDSMAKTENGRNINIVFRIDLNDNYKEIDSGEDKKILSISDLNNFKIDKMAYSFKRYFKDNNEEITKETQVSFIENRQSANLYLKPMFFSSFIVFLFIAMFWYGVLLLIAGYYKFITFGKPFTKR